MSGRSILNIISIEAYDEMISTMKTDRAIANAEAEYAATGRLHDAREVLSSLRRKYFGYREMRNQKSGDQHEFLQITL